MNRIMEKPTPATDPDPDAVMGVRFPKSGIEKAVETACDIAASGLPIGNTGARIKVEFPDLNHGDGKPRPAAVIGVGFSF